MSTQQAADTAMTTESPAPARNGTAPLPANPSDIPTDRMPRMPISFPQRALVLAVIVVTALDVTLGIVAHSRLQHAVIPNAPTVAATTAVPSSTTTAAVTAIAPTRTTVVLATATPPAIMAILPAGIAPTVPLLPLAPSIGGTGGLLIASPNQFSPGAGSGMAQVIWATPDGAVGQVWLSVDGKAEMLFGQGALGAQYAPLTEAGRVYEFHLYTGTEHRGTPSRSVTVTRG